MNRSPLFYPMSRGLDPDAGGAADLQTDVMRFMAIISMCLVAIFALVQSIPLAPTPPPTAEPATVSSEPAEPEPIVEVEIEKPIQLTRPTPAKLPEPEAPVALERPKPKPVERRIPEPQVAAEPPVSKTQKGFTLRFESDAALSRLVERDIVGLYAITPSSIHRMQLESGRMSFWPASAPQRFHEMDSGTVPSAVIDAWQRSKAAGGVKWGVSLPAPMARDLNEYLAASEGGTLVIGRDGKLRLEE
jgi:hypothetical protein